MEYLIDFWDELVNLTVEMAPYLILGFLFAGILYAWFPSDKMTRYLGKNNTASALRAALLGVPLPLCSCGVIPTGISFYKNGASKGSTVSFLISTPQTGADSILVTWSLLGLPLAIIRPVIALFTGVLGGMLTNRIDKGGKSKTKSAPPVSPVLKKKTGIAGMLKYAFGEFMDDIVKWLVIGLLLAALMAVIIPDDFFLRYLSNDYLSMLIILLASIPLYVCATGSVPIAAVLIMKGLSPGAALVFLMAGPATNAATISVIGNAMGRKTLFRYLVSIISGAVFFGLLINEFLPREWFTLPVHGMHGNGHEHGILPSWLQNGSAVLLSTLILNSLIRKYLLPHLKTSDNSAKSLNVNNMNTQINVGGMTCNHCKTTVENGIRGIKGVENATADILTGKVIIEGTDPDLKKVEEVVNSLGYKFIR